MPKDFKSITKTRVSNRVSITVLTLIILITGSMVIASLLPSSGLGNFYAGSTSTVVYGCCIYQHKESGGREMEYTTAANCTKLIAETGINDPAVHWYLGQFCGDDPSKPPPCPVGKRPCSAYKKTICCDINDLCKSNQDTETPYCLPTS